MNKLVCRSLSLSAFAGAMLLAVGSSFAETSGPAPERVPPDRMPVPDRMPPDSYPLPLAGITVGDVRKIAARLSAKYRQPVDKAEFNKLINQLNAPPNCGDIGILCNLVGRDRVPGIFAEAWRAGANGADDVKMFAVLNNAIQQEVQRSAAELAPEIAALEQKLDEAVKSKRLDPNNPAAVNAFLKANASVKLKLIIDWLPNLELGFGIKCDTKTAKSGVKLRRLAVCLGELWGSTTLVLAGKVVTPGLIGVASISAHARGYVLGGSIPENADYLRTEVKYHTFTPTSASNSSWFVIAANVWLKESTPKPCSANGQSEDKQGSTSLNVGPIWVNKNCG